MKEIIMRMKAKIIVAMIIVVGVLLGRWFLQGGTHTFNTPWTLLVLSSMVLLGINIGIVISPGRSPLIDVKPG